MQPSVRQARLGEFGLERRPRRRVTTSPSLDEQHPGFDVDLKVTADATATLYRVYLGRAGLGGAMRTRKLTMSGPRALQRGFGRWFAWSAFAPASRLAKKRRTSAAQLGTLNSVRIAE